MMFDVGGCRRRAGGGDGGRGERRIESVVRFRLCQEGLGVRSDGSQDE